MGEPRLGSVIASKYRLDAELGRGGMGVVFRAFHLRVHKTFALKVLLAEAAAHRSIAKRFFMEAQAAGRIGHPAILDVYDVGEEDDGTPYIVMELLEGESLAAILRRTKLEPSTACWIAREVLDALAAAHDAGVIHRDVKPQNVFVVDKGGRRSVKLLDFGIAKFSDTEGSAVTRSGEIIGSPLYMAPEQAKGLVDVDARVDVWSVGAMLYEMLTGKAAHAASTPVAVLARILTEPATPPRSSEPGISAALDAAVVRALAIARDERFATAREMLAVLGATPEGEVATPVLPPTPERPAIAAASAPGTVSSTAPLAEASRAEGERGSGHGASTVPATGLASSPRRHTVVIVAALALLSGAAIVPWLVPSWTGRGAGTAPSTALGDAEMGTIGATASSSSTSDADVGPVVSASPADAVPKASSGALPPPSRSALWLGSPSAVASGTVSRHPSPGSASAKAPAATVSAPTCGAGEVVSIGHCCPRGLVWENGHCERPLATTF